MTKFENFAANSWLVLANHETFVSLRKNQGNGLETTVSASVNSLIKLFDKKA